MSKPRLAVVAFFLVAACGGSDEATVDAPPGSDAPPGGIDGPPSVDAPIGAGSCGGFAGKECEANEYCDYDLNGCGNVRGIGTCRPRPTDCPDPIAVYTCGCDGVVYSSACDANAAGTDTNNGGGCPVDPGNFACGWTQCSLTGQYCEVQLSDTGGPDEYRCLQTPLCPGPQNCACLASEPCGASCMGTPQTGLTLTCSGG